MLEISNATFGYQSKHNVFDNFSLTINEPGVYGLLGKNGSGKSTLLYLLMGLLRPSSGEVKMNGIKTCLRKPETLKQMFIVPEEYDLPATSLKSFVKAMAPFYPTFSYGILKKCLDGFELPEDISLKQLSMGQKKKIYMCMALAANTKMLLMDEPTNGLDIPSKSQFRKVIAGSLDEDQTIIISTHQVKDIELLLDHVVMIDNSNIIVNDKMSNLFKDDEKIDLEKLFNEKIS